MRKTNSASKKHQRNELVDAPSLNNFYRRDLVNDLGVNASMAYDC